MSTFAKYGHDIATNLGYSLYASSANKTTYMKMLDGYSIFLDVFGSNEAELNTRFKLYFISSGKFQFPHPRFSVFEHQLIGIMSTLTVE